MARYSRARSKHFHFHRRKLFLKLMLLRKISTQEVKRLDFARPINTNAHVSARSQACENILVCLLYFYGPRRVSMVRFVSLAAAEAVLTTRRRHENTAELL